MPNANMPCILKWSCWTEVIEPPQLFHHHTCVPHGGESTYPFHRNMHHINTQRRPYCSELEPCYCTTNRLVPSEPFCVLATKA